MIFINHAGNNALGNFTLKRFALADAAEVFVLLAGYAAGLVYGRTLDNQGWARAAGATVRRSGVVYVAHVFVFVILAALLGWLGTSDDVREKGFAPFAERPFEALREVLLLRYQPPYTDILPLYVVLLALLAGALPLLRRPAVLLSVALAFWATTWGLRLNFPAWPEGGWFLNPLAWQVLFLAGAALGYAPTDAPARSVPLRWWLVAASVAFLIVSKPVNFVLGRADLLAALPGWMGDVLSVFPRLTSADKTFHHPLRLLSVLALAYLAGHAVPKAAAWLRGRAAAPFVLMGQHGLAVFCATIPLSILTEVVIERSGGGWPAQTMVNGAGLVVLLAVAAMAAWLKAPRGSPREAPPTERHLDQHNAVALIAANDRHEPRTAVPTDVLGEQHQARGHEARRHQP